MTNFCMGQNCTAPLTDHSPECVVEHWCSVHGITAESIIVALSEMSNMEPWEICDMAEAWMNIEYYDETI